jgi:enoyl-CoA hydratase/carnithine racemase
VTTIPTTEVAWRIDDRVLRLTLDRPGKKNALTQAMYAAMADALAHAEADPGVRAVLIGANGDAFTAGNDLTDFAGAGEGGDGAAAGGSGAPVDRFLAALAAATVPLVAAVHGVAVGVGTTMLLHCDLVYAAEGTRFRLPFVDLGLVPEAGSTQLLPQLVGHRRAAELLYTGRFFGAEEALALGLVNAVVPAAEVHAAAESAARALTTKPPGALRQTKALLRTPPTSLPERMALEGRAFAARLQSPEFAEAVATFFEGRAPGR